MDELIKKECQFLEIPPFWSLFLEQFFECQIQCFFGSLGLVLVALLLEVAKIKREIKLSRIVYILFYS